MKNFSILTKTFLVLAIFMIAPNLSFAGHRSWCRVYQGGSCNCGYSSSTSVPLDGGLSLLLVAGAAYGGKRYSRMKKQQKEQKEK